MAATHEELMQALGVRGFDHFKIVRRTMYVCQRCGTRTWRPKLCESCVREHARSWVKIRR